MYGIGQAWALAVMSLYLLIMYQVIKFLQVCLELRDKRVKALNLIHQTNLVIGIDIIQVMLDEFIYTVESRNTHLIQHKEQFIHKLFQRANMAAYI